MNGEKKVTGTASNGEVTMCNVRWFCEFLITDLSGIWFDSYEIDLIGDNTDPSIYMELPE